MILVAGNFLNAVSVFYIKLQLNLNTFDHVLILKSRIEIIFSQGGYAGDAAGVKLSSLQKITDIRANRPNMNLVHFVALVSIHFLL